MAHIEIFTVCDSASIRDGMSLLNTYNTIRASAAPALHEFVVATSVGFEVDDGGEHEIRIEIVDSDGKPLGPNQRIEFSFPSPAEVAPVCREIWKFEHSLPTFGDYGFRLSCDGEQLGEITIYFLPSS